MASVSSPNDVARGVVVALDGPAGAGKSSVAKAVADALGYTLLDTGALYRAVAYAAARAGIDPSESERVGALAESLVARNGIAILPGAGTGMRVLVDGVDPGDAIRTPEISMGASTVSAIPRVRAALLPLQQDFPRHAHGVVCEGRDIGTVVFPDAEVKIFLTATVDARAERRFRELVAKGQSVTFEATREDVLRRDSQDAGRSIAPLRQANDAVLVDSTETNLEQTIGAVLALARTAEQRRRVAETDKGS